MTPSLLGLEYDEMTMRLERASDYTFTARLLVLYSSIDGL
jgi:hypothetical protein